MKLEENPHALDSNIPIERVQIGVRMEKRMLKVLKALAEYFDISLGDLLEGMTLHAFDNKTPFSKETFSKCLQRFGGSILPVHNTTRQQCLAS